MAKEVLMSALQLDVQTVTTGPAFRIKENGAVVGDLRVSRGGAFWRPKNHTQYFHLTWEELSELFQKNGQAKTVGEYKITAPTGSFEDF